MFPLTEIETLIKEPRMIRSKQTPVEVVAERSFLGKPNEGHGGRIRRAQRFTTTLARAEELEKLHLVRRVKVVDPVAETKDEISSKPSAKESTSTKSSKGKSKGKSKKA